MIAHRPSTALVRRAPVAALGLAVLLHAAPALAQAPAQSVATHAADSWELPRDGRPLEIRIAPSGHAYASAEWLVGLADQTKLLEVVAAAEELGGVLVGEVPRLGILAVDAPNDDESFGAALAARVDVSWATRNGLGEGGGTPPNDTHFADQWHLSNTGQSGGTPDADGDVLEAWDIEQGDPVVTLAVIDSGIDFAHPEFAGRTLPGYDFVNEDADPTADNPHGIWVTGLAAANGDNALQVAGIDRRCTIVPVKVLDQNNQATVFDLIQSLDYCAAQQVDVVSMSLINFIGDPGLQAALQGARNAGCVLLACAGNSGIGNADTSWPGASPLTITIGATNDEDQRAGYSGTGNALDFVASGDDVISVSLSHGDGFDLFNGCSAATPVAAGMASLLLARFPGIDQDCVYDLLRAGAEDGVGHVSEDTVGWDPFHGHGRLNAFKSLASLLPCNGQALLSATSGLIEVAGGTQDLELEAGASHAGEVFFVLGSATGTSPAFLVDLLPLPLVPDAYSLFTLANPNSVVLPGSLGLLDGTGSGAAQFHLPQGTSTNLVGVTFHHAALVFDGNLVVSTASNATPAFVVDTQVAFADDFETGGPGWTLVNVFGGLWHVALPGECGVAGRALAFQDGPANCTYNTAVFNVGSAQSPTFTLSGMPPYRVSFDAVLDFDTTGLGQDSATLRLVEVGGTATEEIWNATGLPSGPGLQSFDVQLANPAAWVGKTILLEVGFARNAGGDQGTGFAIEKLAVTTSSL